jgi:transposase InsO family protein
MRASLAVDALQMATDSRQPEAGLIHHSDRGSQYASDAFQAALVNNEYLGSMSRKGNCWDNAVAESFFKSLKQELVYQQRFTTREQARLAVFEYVEVYYNRQRKHSRNEYLSPADYEARKLKAA